MGSQYYEDGKVDIKGFHIGNGLPLLVIMWVVFCAVLVLMYLKL